MRLWLAVLILGGAVMWAYAPGLDGPMVLDDDVAIVANPDVRVWPDLLAALNPPERLVGFSRRPVLNLTMAWNHHLGGLEVRGYRVFNLALHLAATLLLAGLVRWTLRHGRGVPEILRQRAGAVAFFAALLWGVHPLATSAVNYLTQRGELLVTVAVLAFLWMWGQALAGGSRWWILPAWLACLAGMGSKESMLGMPLVAVLYDRALFAGSWREVGRRWSWYALLLLTAAWPAALMLRNVTDIAGEGGRGDYDRWRYYLTQGWGLAQFLKLAFWPRPLIFDYGTELAAGLRAVWGELLLAALALLGICWWSLRRRSWVGIFLLAVAAASLLPSLAFTLSGQPVAEHRMYLPLAALITAVVCALASVVPPQGLGKWIAATAAVAVALLMIHLTRARHADYAEVERLWRVTLEARPSSARARLNLAFALLAQRSPGETGRIAEAATLLDAATRIDPNYGLAHFNLGTLLLEQGRPIEARRAFARAVEVWPGYAPARINLANMLLAAGEMEEAIEQSTAAVQLAPEDPDAWNVHGSTLVSAGRPADAVAAFDQALERTPSFAPAWAGRAGALAATGRMQEALRSHERAVEAAPEDVRLRYNFAMFLLGRGRLEEAAAQLREVSLRRPDMMPARFQLALVCWQLGQEQEALRLLRELVASDGGGLQVWSEAAQALEAAGKPADAARLREAAGL